MYALFTYLARLWYRPHNIKPCKNEWLGLPNGKKLKGKTEKYESSKNNIKHDLFVHSCHIAYRNEVRLAQHISLQIRVIVKYSAGSKLAS